MNNLSKFKVIGGAAIFSMVAFTSCKKEVSSITGWAYNDQRYGGYEKQPYIEQETGPGLILIEGGTYVMGRVEQDVFYNWDNVPRRVTVSSFYMDETEISNHDYREYLYWLDRMYGSGPDAEYPGVYEGNLPDTLVWRSKMAFNEAYVEYYFRHPSYRDYPVVGVNWIQASDFCTWRTDRVNEMILVREGIQNLGTIDQNGEEHFNTDAYLLTEYTGTEGKDQLLNYRTGERRKVKIEDGILLPNYRLPTEAEWEYAALSLIGNTDPNQDREVVQERRLYPWNGHVSRNPNEKYKGDFLANFQRGRGDMMGSAGRLNDGADVTAPVRFYWPNDFGLYQMAGNVAEWTMDVYRPVSLQDMDGFRPYRGNVFKKLLLDNDGYIEERDSIGKVRRVNIDPEKDAKDRINYKKDDYRDYKDGDYVSSVYYEDPSYLESDKQNMLMYQHGFSSLVNNNARVVKGGSWKDRAYWMVPGTRRYMDEKIGTDWIGFRCAMDRLGSPVGLGGKNTRKGMGGGQYSGKTVGYR